MFKDSRILHRIFKIFCNIAVNFNESAPGRFMNTRKRRFLLKEGINERRDGGGKEW